MKIKIFSASKIMKITNHYFTGTKDDVFPTASFCLGNQFLKAKLDEYGIDETSYLAFLSRTSFAKEMLNINFSYVTMDITNYIKGYQIYFKK